MNIIRLIARCILFALAFIVAILLSPCALGIAEIGRREGIVK